MIPTVGAGEILVAQGFDESGLTFALVYNPSANIFIWALDPKQSMPDMQYCNLTELVTRRQGCGVPGYQLTEAQVLACLHHQ